MTTADVYKQEAAIDGLALLATPMYEVVVTSKAGNSTRSTPMTFEMASRELARIVKIHMVELGYKQSASGDKLTLVKENLTVQIQMAEVKRAS